MYCSPSESDYCIVKSFHFTMFYRQLKLNGVKVHRDLSNNLMVQSLNVCNKESKEVNIYHRTCSMLVPLYIFYCSANCNAKLNNKHISK